MSDVESTLQRISSHKGVLGCIVVNKDNIILKTTCEPEVAELHSHLIPQLAILARNMVRDLDPQACPESCTCIVGPECFPEAIRKIRNDCIASAIATFQEHVYKNELEFLRIRSMKQEIMVAPHAEFVLIVIQDLKSEARV